MLYRSTAVHLFPNADELNISDAGFLKRPFLLRIPQKIVQCDRPITLLSIPGTLTISTVYRTAADDADGTWRREGCFAFADATWTLQADCRMRVNKGSATDTFSLSIPLDQRWLGKKMLSFWFDGTWLRFLGDGEVLNENTGLDLFCEPTAPVETDSAFGAVSAFSAASHTVTYTKTASSCFPGYYYPAGINANVGDVMSFYHDGTYHLLYLLDRRHHRSRNGAGAHYIAHITSNDLVDWYEQPPVAELTAPWMSFGTGTMLFSGGRYYMTYGLHTERYLGDEQKFELSPDENGCYHPVAISEVLKRGEVPAGATCSVSDDGIHFEPSGILFHSARNPSAYTSGDRIKLYAGFSGEGDDLMTAGGGVYETDDFAASLCPSDEKFDYIYHSPMRNTSECPSFFEWNGYRYLLVGFTGYYRSMQKGGIPEDATRYGENIYDGLAVPMVSVIKDNRCLMAGWAECGLGWGSLLFQRELVQENGGKLGMKWVPELVPKACPTELLKTPADLIAGVTLKSRQNYLLTFSLKPDDAARIGLSFGDGDTGCTLEWNIAENRAQIGSAPFGKWAPRIETMHEQMAKAAPDAREYRATGAIDIPRDAGNYALPDFDGMGDMLSVRVMVYRSHRIHATVLDVEVNERRTMLSVRGGFFPTAVKLMADQNVENLQASLRETATPEWDLCR